MRFRLTYLGMVLYFLKFTTAYAQQDLFPAHFGQIHQSRGMLNAVVPNTQHVTNLSFCNQFYTGAFSKIDNLFFIGNVNLSKAETSRNISTIGVKFVAERDGEYISRSKYYFSYTFQTKISESYWLGLGLDIGRANYVYKGTNVSSYGSDANWDGDVGGAFYNSSFCMALSANQIFNTLVLPRDTYFRWRRFYVAYAEKKIRLGEKADVVFYVQNQFLPQQTDVLDLGVNFILVHHLLLGSNVYLNRSISFLAGLQNMSIDQHHFSLFMSYNVPASSQANANVQSFEMSLTYYFKPASSKTVEE